MSGQIEEGTVVPPDSILAPFSCYAGVPGLAALSGGLGIEGCKVGAQVHPRALLLLYWRPSSRL
eukprot:3846682-Rhodomonas_salina.1